MFLTWRLYVMGQGLQLEKGGRDFVMAFCWIACMCNDLT